MPSARVEQPPEQPMRHLEARGFQVFAKVAKEFPGRAEGAADTGGHGAAHEHDNSGPPRSSVGAVGVGAMRISTIAMVVAFPALVMTGNMTAVTAAETKQDIKGLYLLTDYPAVSVRPGATSTIALRLQNYGLPPENLALS